MTFDAKPVVIDGRGHLLGRLASIIAKVRKGAAIVTIQENRKLYCMSVNASLEQLVFKSTRHVFICIMLDISPATLVVTMGWDSK